MLVLKVCEKLHRITGCYIVLTVVANHEFAQVIALYRIWGTQECERGREKWVRR